MRFQRCEKWEEGALYLDLGKPVEKRSVKKCAPRKVPRGGLEDLFISFIPIY